MQRAAQPPSIRKLQLKRGFEKKNKNSIAPCKIPLRPLDVKEILLSFFHVHVAFQHLSVPYLQPLLFLFIAISQNCQYNCQRWRSNSLQYSSQHEDFIGRCTWVFQGYSNGAMPPPLAIYVFSHHFHLLQFGKPQPLTQKSKAAHVLTSFIVMFFLLYGLCFYSFFCSLYISLCASFLSFSFICLFYLAVHCGEALAQHKVLKVNSNSKNKSTLRRPMWSESGPKTRVASPPGKAAFSTSAHFAGLFIGVSCSST